MNRSELKEKIESLEKIMVEVDKIRQSISILSAQTGLSISDFRGLVFDDTPIVGAKTNARKTATLSKKSIKTAAKKKGKTRKLPPVPAKYRNPNNPAETWTGRGRSPIWLAKLEMAGRSRDEYLIHSVAR